MKIAISTIIDYNNYGNRLQNYALQEVLHNLGHDVETIRNFSETKISTKNKIITNLKNGDILRKIKYKIEFFLNKNSKEYKKFLQYNTQRNLNFKNFSEKYIKETKFIVNETTINFDFNKDYDCFVIGSDQVWNYNFTRFSKFDFISYSETPKVSYAASFGVDSIPEEYINMYKEGLSNINYISVRENAGKDIVEKLTEKPAKVVLDPTLLLNKNDWLKLAKGSKKYNEKYALTYFLDTPTDVTQKYIQEYATSNNLKVKSLVNKNDLELWKADPIEFVNLFSQAESIFTDSFHACVFSIIFEKYFEVFERNTRLPSMNSRIDTLLEELNLVDRWHSNKILSNIDYKDVVQRLENKKIESITFLKNSLDEIAQYSKF